MNLAAYSPRKLNLFNQCSPRASARKRSLFPTSSPQTNDLGMISELCSDDSDVYSPPPASPSSSVTPSKEFTSPLNKSNNILKVSNHLQFDICLPKKTSVGKENSTMSTEKSAKKSSHEALLNRQQFDECFFTMLSESPGKQIMNQFEIKSSDNMTTPKKHTEINNSLHHSPRSASKPKVTLKPSSFYGKLAPILTTNQTNRIEGMKCVFRPSAGTYRSKAKTKLLFEDKKPAKKRERSKSFDPVREAKRRKPVFTGVHHAIPKPVKRSPSAHVSRKQDSIRERALNNTDLSRTPYNIKKKKQAEGWEYTLRFTKPMRYEEAENMGNKRKFFKTIVKDSPEQVKIVSPLNGVLPNVKKRKLLDTRKKYFYNSILEDPEKSVVDSCDIRELIEDDVDKLQDKPEVEDILLRLEEEDEEEKKKEVERQMLMNILEDSPIKTVAIDRLSDCTASLDLNDSNSLQGSCSRFSLEATSPGSLPFFNRSSFGTNDSAKKKWRGVGDGQLQIDAGQKWFGARQCSECGMVFQAGEAEDEIQHNVFHNNLSTLRHMGWKNETVVGCFGLDYVMVITGDDVRSWQQKACDVLSFVDKSLGITSDSPNVMHNQKVFLYVSEKRIVGCMVASPVSRAYRMMSSESDVDICSEESYPVRCGVSRMWTLFSHRRQGVASKLLDTVRRNFMYGYILAKEDIAFSIPTPDGKKFAAKYMDSQHFFVYTGY